MNRTLKLIEQWNEDEAQWRRYVEIRLGFRSIAPYGIGMDDAIEAWAWLEAAIGRGPLDCVGIVTGAVGNE